ncbi:Transposase and inactivated derivatives [Phocoenobacter uteri]|uniref:Transposase and inactivated derivatives n=1 Tax=Phocoenobacter uteri TaxID=146806 RepID=A0A379CCF8_9PAST|nr:transposase [Phocoenobacter uteri]MDG6881398.1 hypothetical protein [Phocoenobacter uteri]SUB59426.1 Transposase and inactivated derivatives [Phocoenobacter uteri]
MKNKFKSKSLRLRYWNYQNSAVYFVTICTKNKVHYFGEIVQEKIHYSPIGSICYVLWNEMQHRNKHIILGDFVIMPNHIHAILILLSDNIENNNHLGTNRFQNIGKNSLSSIIGGYKSSVSRYAHKLNFEFQWQSNFYEHIVRNEYSLEKISQYILENPTKWSKKYNNDL